MSIFLISFFMDFLKKNKNIKQYGKNILLKYQKSCGVKEICALSVEVYLF